MTTRHTSTSRNGRGATGVLTAVALLIALLGPRTWAEGRVLILAGQDSHGWGEHSHHDVGTYLAETINSGATGLRAELALDRWLSACESWPDLRAVVLYSDGEREHPLIGKRDALATLAAKGVGFVCIHYGLDVSPEPLGRQYLAWLGGYFEENWSVNPVWTPTDVLVASHATTRGITSFSLKDEWYYHMRFREGMAGVRPILTAIPPAHTVSDEDGARTGNSAVRAAVGAGRPQVLAWATQNADGSRGFGFTGGHTAANWLDRDFRTLILNGIVWAAGADVPAEGVPSEDPLILRYETLTKAVARGDVADVRRHLRKGADLKKANASGWTALHYAVLRNKLEVTRVLLENGADANAVTAKKLSTLHFCAQRNYLEMAELLIGKDTRLDLGDQDGWTALHHAAAHNRLEMAKLFLEKGADVNAVSTRGGTPLHEGAASAGKELIQLLLDRGARKETKAQNGKTALDYAIELENEEAVAVLK